MHLEEELAAGRLKQPTEACFQSKTVTPLAERGLYHHRQALTVDPFTILPAEPCGIHQAKAFQVTTKNNLIVKKSN